MSRETAFLPDDAYRFIGLPLAVRSNSQEVLDYIRSAYRQFYIAGGGEATQPSGDGPAHTPVLQVTDRIEESQELFVQDDFESYALRCTDLFALDPEDPHSTDGVPYPLAYVQWSVLKHIASRAEEHYLIHAGVVSWGGQALVFPGISGRGKTTLCLGLVDQGFKLLSDEVACLHRSSGRVAPFPRAIRLDERSRSLLGIDPAHVDPLAGTDPENVQWSLDAGRAFPGAVNGQATFRYLIFLGGFAKTSRLKPLSQTAALLKLFTLCLNTPKNSMETLFGFGSVMKGVRCFSLTTGELAETVAVVRALVDATGDTMDPLR